MSRARPDSPLEKAPTYDGERMYEGGTLLASYDLDLERVVAALVARPEWTLVGLQFPDGLRDYATEIEKTLAARVPGREFIVSADPCYGACDLALNLERVGVHVLVHFGHTDMPSINHLVKWPVLYVAARHKAPVGAVVVEAAKRLPGKRVGLITTAQHAHKLDEAAQALAAAGFEALVGEGDNRLGGMGQLLGCNFTAGTSIENDVDGFVYVGSGDFHPIAMRFGTRKPVVLADPYTNEVRDVEETYDRFLRQRFATIERARGAKKFGVLVGTKVGQERMKLAIGLKRLLEQQGKEAHLIALDFFSWDNLLYFRHLDALVNTSCPRITTDDYSRYPMPMLTPQELEVVLGRRTWEAYAFDEFKGTKPAPKGDARIALRVKAADAK
ncbi:MAG: diphthamide biosynthesis enzyme Dph2 [Thermoplasmatota archaeon]